MCKMLQSVLFETIGGIYIEITKENHMRNITESRLQELINDLDKRFQVDHPNFQIKYIRTKLENIFDLVVEIKVFSKLSDFSFNLILPVIPFAEVRYE